MYYFTYIIYNIFNIIIKYTVCGIIYIIYYYVSIGTIQSNHFYTKIILLFIITAVLFEVMNVSPK